MPRTDFSFSDLFISAQARGEPFRVFDWEKAARLIAERQPAMASAGLERDWVNTSGLIWMDGEPVPSRDTYTYLASAWATPLLIMDGEEIECWRPREEVPEWDASTYWPPEALTIVGKEMDAGVAVDG